MNRCCVFLVLAAAAAGCATASPWPLYESALRCHLDGKKTECDADYKKAIEIDPKTQGLHASYATHLLLTGRMQEAEKEFAIENQNYPAFAAIGINRLAAKGPAGASDMTPAAADQPGTGAPPASASPPVAPAPQPVSSTKSKQGGVR
jgi:hypothetical protein